MKLQTRGAAIVLGGSILALGAYLLGRAQAREGPGVEPLLYSGLLLEDGLPTTNEQATIGLDLLAPGGSDRVCDGFPEREVELLGGHFQLALHDGCRDVIAHQPQLLVQLKVNGETLPLRALGTVPYAFHADTARDAQTLAGESPGNFARIGHTHAHPGDAGVPTIGLRSDAPFPLHLSTFKVGGDLNDENCYTEECDIRAQSGSVESIERTDEGSYWATFKPGTYAGAPTCLCNTFQGRNRACTAVTPSADRVGIHTYQAQTAEEGMRDYGFEVLCIGFAGDGATGVEAEPESQ